MATAAVVACDGPSSILEISLHMEAFAEGTRRPGMNEILSEIRPLESPLRCGSSFVTFVLCEILPLLVGVFAEFSLQFGSPG